MPNSSPNSLPNAFSAKSTQLLSPPSLLRAQESRKPVSPALQPSAGTGASDGGTEGQPLLKRRRLRLGEQAGEGLRFNAQLPALGDRMAALFSPRSLPESTPRSTHSQSASPGQKGFCSPSSTLAGLLDPPTPVSRHHASAPWAASSALDMERKRQSAMRAASTGVVLSPRLVSQLSQKPIQPDLLYRLTALKPGAGDISNGFIPLTLERPSIERGASAMQAMQKIGSGAFGTVYNVRLSDSFWRDGKDCGRDFVFKAMLSTDPAHPVSRRLHEDMAGDAPGLDRAISQEKESIYKEYQVAASLGDTAQVMRVYGLVQIDALYGILSEKIEGPTVGQVIERAGGALNAGAASPQEYVALGREMLADVLIGASRFADEGVVHQDISHNNVLYDETRKMFRLIDMGQGGEEGEPSRMGTMGYIDMQPSAHPKSDVYRAAQLFVHFLKSPAHRMGFIGISSASSAETFPFMDALKTLPAQSKEDIVKFFNRMVTRSLDERASAEELLRDPFFSEMPSRDDIHAIYQRLIIPA